MAGISLDGPPLVTPVADVGNAHVTLSVTYISYTHGHNKETKYVAVCGRCVTGDLTWGQIFNLQSSFDQRSDCKYKIWHPRVKEIDRRSESKSS